MEVTSLSTNSVKIKGKLGTFAVNPSGKIVGYNAVLLLGNQTVDKTKLEPGTIIIKGPGEYEIAGIKISGFRVADETAFRLTVDKVVLIVGSASSLEKDHSKVSDNHLVILFADTISDPSFVTALEPNAVLFFGEKAEDTVKQFAKENYRKEQKYQTTIDKLPAELESILLTA